MPTGSRTAPTGSQWAYEIKHDGFRFICHREGERVRVFSRTGHEWGAQLPAIAAALRALPVRSVILDGEGVICGPDGASDFDRMRAVFGRKGSPDVFLYAFDVLEPDGRPRRNGAKFHGLSLHGAILPPRRPCECGRSPPDYPTRAGGFPRAGCSRKKMPRQSGAKSYTCLSTRGVAQYMSAYEA